VRIAFLSWRDTTHPDGGGSEVFVESLGAELVGRGHEVTVLCARYRGSTAREIRRGVRLRRLGGRLSVYPLGLLWLWWRRRHVDVVVDVVNGLPFGAPLVRRRGVLALVHHVHAAQWHIIYPGWRGRLGWFVESRVVPLIYRRTHFLTVSESSRRDLRHLGIAEERLHVVRNGIPAIDRPRVHPSPTPRLCVLARLVPHKQIEHAFAVVAALAPEFPDLHLDVVGEGWWHGRLEQDVAAAGVADRVTFHGHVPDDRRDAVLARSWLLVIPSVKEGWCLAVSEAARVGRPSIAYASAGGVTESIVDGTTGLLVADLDAMVEATRLLLRDPALRSRLGEAARAGVRELTWQRSAHDFEQVVRGVLHSH